MRRPNRQHGVILVALAVSLAVISVGYLSFVAYTSRLEGQVVKEKFSKAALYAAESGLVKAEHSLQNASSAPPTGLWFAETLPVTGASVRVEVTEVEGQPDLRDITSLGQVTDPLGKRHNALLGARVKLKETNRWVVVWREQITSSNHKEPI